MNIIGTLSKAQDEVLVQLQNDSNKLYKDMVLKDCQVHTEGDESLIFKGLIYSIGSDDYTDNQEVLAEKLFQLYKTEGIQSFKMVNGKATILIRNNEGLIVFRDHHGEGPSLFFNQNGFSDSVEGMQALGEAKEVDEVSMQCFLKYGFIPAPLTIFKGISKVPAGELMTLKKGTVSFTNLYDYKDFKEEELKIEMPEAIEEYDRLLKLSIKRRINGFDTVGTLLSGGYDSGGNIAVLREVFSGTIKSYSIGFKDNPFSELPYAKMMADEFGAQHHEYEMDGVELDQLPEAIKAFGEPFSESGFMVNNSAMRMVQNEGLPVIIGGDGNDQLMGTTGKELALHLKIKNKKIQFAQKIFKGVSGNSMFEKDNIFYKLRFHNEKILNVMRPDNFGFNQHLLGDVFKLKGVGEHPFVNEIPTSFNGFREFHDQHQFHLDIRHSINEVILNKASRLSSYYGNNLGFTYIDLDIYNFIKKLPLDIRLKGNLDDLASGKGVTKFIHKSYCKPKLPKEVTERKKQGGFSPLAMFFNDKNRRQEVYEYIRKSDFAKQYMHSNGVEKFFSAYDKGAQGDPYWFWFTQLKSNQLINILIMTIWWDIYMNGKTETSLKDFM